MKLKNYTTVNDETLREIIRFVKPSGVSRFDISFKNCLHQFRGSTYTDGCAYHDTVSPLVIVSIGCKYKYPTREQLPEAGSGYLPVPDIYSLTEMIVYVTAHELRHLWQKLHPRGWRVWGARGQYSERDADAYAVRMLRAWRRQ